MGIIIFLNPHRMNLLEVTERNFFLKQLFPEGVEEFFIGQVELTCFDRITMTLHTFKQPKIGVKKWGEWGRDYNIITLDMLFTNVNKFSIQNWQNNRMDIAIVSIEKNLENKLVLIFEGNQWKLEIEAGVLTYQSSSVYIIDK